MSIEIKRWTDGKVVYVAKDARDVKGAVEAARVENANLRDANLRGRPPRGLPRPTGRVLGPRHSRHSHRHGRQVPSPQVQGDP